MLLFTALAFVISFWGCDAWGPPGATAVTITNWPTSAFSSYYFVPASPTKEPQPIIQDPILGTVFPSGLTDLDEIPLVNTVDPLYYPTTTTSIAASAQPTYLAAIVSQVSAIIENTTYTSNCTKCIAALQAAQPAARAVPLLVPSAMVSLCQTFKYASNATCVLDYNASTFGDIWVQVLAYANVSGSDGQYICNSLGYCPKQTALPLNITGWFPKPKPANATAPKASGQRIKVAHLSDFHLDARYAVGSEANCTTNLCCRQNNNNTSANPGQVLLPAPFYGSFQCDSPYGLGVSALQAFGPLTGTNSSSPLGFAIYTGDLVSHDPQYELSRALTEYTETTVYGLFKTYLGSPVFAALGNHDTSPENMDAQVSLPGPLGTQMSWNYQHVAGLWAYEGWIPAAQLSQASTHYGGYSVQNQFGLRIISFNTDLWYHDNWFTFINTTDPDNSGIFNWMISELQAAEDAGERVWIIGHVLSGWDGSNPNPNPTNLFYQIVDRYSPHVIANIFFGHTHEDQFTIFYANNATVMNSSTALNTAWIGPSVTPLTNLNSGFRLYEVDTGDFNVYDAWTFYANVSSFPSLHGNNGPVWQLEYSTRDTYGPAANWSSNAPLNATFWHQVTVAMQSNASLVTLHNQLQGKLSSLSPNCTNAACVAAKICYMRAGSQPLGAACPQGYGSVQSKFTPTS